MRNGTASPPAAAAPTAPATAAAMAYDAGRSRLEAHLDTLLVVRPSSGGHHPPQEFRGSMFVLSHYSPFLRAALSKEWAQGEGRRVELTEDPQAFGNLLNFMHSMGDADRLPTGERCQCPPAACGWGAATTVCRCRHVRAVHVAAAAISGVMRHPCVPIRLFHLQMRRLSCTC